MTTDFSKYRSDFPVLNTEVNGKPLVYLDSGASAQKPQTVIDAVTGVYSATYANVHRGLHTLSNISTEQFEAVRGKIARFLGAPEERSIVMTSGTTESINLAAYGWAMPRLGAGDEILLSVMEHHANIVPWHFLRERQGVALSWVAPENNGALSAEAVIAAITPRTRLIAITQMSNVLGTVVDVATICAHARKLGIPVLVDGSQSAVHMPVNVEEIGCDFFAITGHKLYGPTGSGALYIHPDRIKEMRPFMGGGAMIREVSREAVSYADPPLCFEAGTPAIAEMIGLGAALDYIETIGRPAIAAHEANLTAYAQERLSALPWLCLQGNAPGKGGIFSFTMAGAGHPHDLSTILDQSGVAVRAGHHCAAPLMDHLGLTATCRASLGLYNNTNDIDTLINALTLAHELLG